MRQVLFSIPLHSLWDILPDIPIYGYGTMLFLAFVFCTVLAVRLARREGISKEILQDLAVWIFISGILGARTVFIIQYRENFTSFWQFFQLWDGGLVFYGGPIGAVIGYALAYVLWLRKHHLSSWKIADVVAPCAALGLALGRVGCLLNGCCYGNVACPECPALAFPLPAPPMSEMVKRGNQTVAGFTMERVPNSTNFIVRSVEAGSPAAQAGLRPEDKIVKVNDTDIENYYDLVNYHWPRGKNDLVLMVERNGPAGEHVVSLGPFNPLTLGLNPTQIYESISMTLLLFFLLSYYPFKKRDGSVMVFFMIGYGVHRFLNEMLRTDTEKVAFDMTLSQNISIVVLLTALVLAAAVWRRGPRPETPQVA